MTVRLISICMIVALASASKQCGSRLAGQLLFTIHVTDALPSATAMNPVSVSARTRALAETLAGAALRASAISVSRGSRLRLPVRDAAWPTASTGIQRTAAMMITHALLLTSASYDGVRHE